MMRNTSMNIEMCVHTECIAWRELNFNYSLQRTKAHHFHSLIKSKPYKCPPFHGWFCLRSNSSDLLSKHITGCSHSTAHQIHSISPPMKRNEYYFMLLNFFFFHEMRNIKSIITQKITNFVIKIFGFKEQENVSQILSAYCE